ncbi:DUF4177 domain-containing protein [Zhouia amylolytica]|uniref:DUF4177 domain-containing protein n=1 Tax=Zhouia amylolytica AD3 TaxID=1286632 RepID=W2US16_9FLAO|nr:DUF4177 domain-containing protein [Zhouia amylolytica]ETN96970.1 hypothetical protein P278_03960 [Zhouia amylolytica AD3]
MKEYKILKQKSNLFTNTDKNFEAELNGYARDGWRVVTTVFSDKNFAIKAILERDKNER